MTQVFTTEEFKGYNFTCSTIPANVGFKHLCIVTDTNNLEVARASQQWMNRTWESYQYETVFKEAKVKLEATLNPVENNQKLDLDFLCTLACNDYIQDYGILYDTEDEYVILMDSWTQVEGRKEYNKDTNNWELVKKSVYAKLLELAEQGRLKPSINYTLTTLEYVFSDEYQICDECRKIYNTYYGEGNYVEDMGMCLCSDCQDNEEVLEVLIDKAKDDFNKALKPEVDEDKLIDLGYEKLNKNSYSLSLHQWGETRFGYDYIDIDFAKDLCKAFNGFVKLESIQQFDSPFFIYVPSNNLDEAKKALANGSL